MKYPIAAALLIAGWLPMVAGIVRGDRTRDGDRARDGDRIRDGERDRDREQPAARVDRVLLFATWMWCIALTLLAVIDVRAAGDGDQRRVTAGVVLFLVSTVAWTWARRAMGDRFAQVARVPPALVRTGPYRYLRHPMYVATALAVAGQALAAGTTRCAALALATIVILGVRAWREERLLEAAFAQGWRDYARHSLGVRSPARRR